MPELAQLVLIQRGEICILFCIYVILQESASETMNNKMGSSSKQSRLELVHRIGWLLCKNKTYVCAENRQGEIMPNFLGQHDRRWFLLFFFYFSKSYKLSLISLWWFLITTKYLTNLPPQKKPCNFPIIYIPDCAFPQINVKTDNNDWVESVTQDNNFVTLPACVTLKFFSSNEKTEQEGGGPWTQSSTLAWHPFLKACC